MKELFAALAQAQAEIGAAIKDSTNPHFRSKYADLASVVAAIKPVAAKHGLGYIQRFGEAQGGVSVETVIVHKSGESFPTGMLFVPASKQDAQGYGSAITYARRYSLQTAWGVPADDDDGNAATAAAPRIAPVAEAAKGINVDPVKIAKVISALVDQYEAHTQDPGSQDYAVRETVDPLTQDERIAVWNGLAGQSKIRAWIKAVQAKDAAAA